jgi:hypothetical protein
LHIAERKKLLADKIAANRQRLTRSKYLDKLPCAISVELQQAEVIYAPNDKEIKKYGLTCANGVGRENTIIPDNYEFVEYSWPEQLFAALEIYPDHHDSEQAYLMLYNGLVFRVQFGWARKHLPYFFKENGYGGVSLVSESITAGIAMFKVVGYAKIDPNPNELIYELATWS